MAKVQDSRMPVATSTSHKKSKGLFEHPYQAKSTTPLNDEMQSKTKDNIVAHNTVTFIHHPAIKTNVETHDKHLGTQKIRSSTPWAQHISSPPSITFRQTQPPSRALPAQLASGKSHHHRCRKPTPALVPLFHQERRSFRPCP